MSVLRQSCPIIFSAVAGLATGASLYLLYFRLKRELAEIRVLIVELKQEIKTSNDGNGRRRRRGNRTTNSGYYSVAGSSGDDDDDFVDAIAGLSDQEFTTRWQNGPAATERNTVQFASPVSVEMDADQSQSDEHFFKELDRLFTAGSDDDFESAYVLMKKRERKMSFSPEFQWRLSKTLYNVSSAAGRQEGGDGGQKKELLYLAKDAALACVNLDPQCPQGHTWYAITLGTVGDYEPTAEKIKNGFEIKVYMLSWLERKAAAAFFGTPPTATVDEALSHFMQAENLKPGKWGENSLFIAKCFIEKRQYDDAVLWLRKGQSESGDSDDDPDVQTEVSTLLAKYDR